MIDALLDSRARAGQQCAALRELWAVICTALEITAAQECERVFRRTSVTGALNSSLFPRLKKPERPKA